MSGQTARIKEVKTSPFSDQKAGSSGLRRKVTVFQQQNFTENFVHCVLSSIPENERNGCTIIVGGDGRYYMKDTIQIIARMAAAIGVSLVYIFI